MHHPQLDGIRGIMAWWVVIGHLVNYFGASHLATNDILIRVLTLTSLPVDIFICISGFVIFAALSKRDPMAEYATNRFFRIYPVYFLILIVAIASEPFRLAGMQAADWVFDFGKAPHAVTEVAGLNHIAHIVLHLLLLHGAVPDQILLGSGDKFIGPAWSLSLEWQFYVIAPLLYMAGRHSLRTLLLSLLGLVATKAALYHAGLSFSYGGFLPLKIEMFSLGMMSFYFASPPPRKTRWPHSKRSTTATNFGCRSLIRALQQSYAARLPGMGHHQPDTAPPNPRQFPRSCIVPIHVCQAIGLHRHAILFNLSAAPAAHPVTFIHCAALRSNPNCSHTRIYGLVLPRRDLIDSHAVRYSLQSD
jgi:peptidoglycan/LPS O-acetylase OafA/YrhL